MAFKITLNTGSRTYDVMNFSFSFSRQMMDGATIISGGDLVFTMDMKNDTSLVETILNPHARLMVGEVRFIEATPTGNTLIKEIKFVDGYIQGYQETASTDGPNNVLINFILTSKEVKIGSATFKNQYM